ncbi:hypothetical protein BDQ94DRAFT_136716 [Aspergillus welwitschiae]|uniref:Uncharacterized protein n=1 Tax=Aspergillus welwitschiae TaxID=1341132 RepID=A0A3F3QEC0_9EURO|nr:hypothetical protein BDQ94DRAFT_136716 [Aspergillus welwitschiae]RDH37601.1 hypothetical protein BDQ94DRAFT_136716 [Aspergillus welwitschiae]
MTFRTQSSLNRTNTTPPAVIHTVHFEENTRDTKEIEKARTVNSGEQFEHQLLRW